MVIKLNNKVIKLLYSQIAGLCIRGLNIFIPVFNSLVPFTFPYINLCTSYESLILSTLSVPNIIYYCYCYQSLVSSLGKFSQASASSLSGSSSGKSSDSSVSFICAFVSNTTTTPKFISLFHNSVSTLSSLIVTVFQVAYVTNSKSMDSSCAFYQPFDH